MGRKLCGPLCINTAKQLVAELHLPHKKDQSSKKVSSLVLSVWLDGQEIRHPKGKKNVVSIREQESFHCSNDYNLGTHKNYIYSSCWTVH